ncbi:hypothetical protein [Arenivirga flava]|uniref:hypothetical protein n=1 Tax=Arenivirga flava TaxID=1930060 RepID=UPI0024E0886A|nr:hypothetical protein [Arenivirga flava]
MADRWDRLGQASDLGESLESVALEGSEQACEEPLHLDAGVRQILDVEFKPSERLIDFDEIEQGRILLRREAAEEGPR